MQATAETPRKGLHWKWLSRLGIRGRLALMGLLPMALLLTLLVLV
jgi:hypothetical protein